jgi:hypothetical protein
VTTSAALATLALTRANATAGVSTSDGVPKVTPTGPYWVFYDADDYGYADRADNTANRLRWGFRLVCCGVTPAHVRFVCDLARATFTGWRPNGVDPLFELDIGSPLLPATSVAGDFRYSRTLEFRLYTNRI